MNTLSGAASAAAVGRPTAAGTDRASHRDRRSIPSALSVEALDLLQELCAVQARLVLPLAAAAAVLDARSVWFAFGYRNRADFVREKFDRTSRWFRDLVRLQEGITRLPGLAMALCGADGGLRLGHKAALCIARVATAETFAEWVARARELSLAELEQLLRVARTEAGSDAGAGSEAEEGSAVGARTEAPVDDSVSNRACVRLHGPPELRLAFDAGHDLHAAVVGRESSLGSFVEALHGEAVSAGCETEEDLRADILDRLQREARARAPQGKRGTLRASYKHRKQQHSSSKRYGSTPAGKRALQLLVEFQTFDTRLLALELKIARHERASANRALSQTYVRQLEQLTCILFGLLDLDGRLHLGIADLLLDLHDRRAWRSLGFSGLEDCAESLGLVGSTARHWVDVVRRSRRHERLRRAHETGSLGNVATLWVARILETLPGHATSAAALIEHARLASVKHLRDEEKCWRRELLLGQVAIAESMLPTEVRRRLEAAAMAEPDVKIEGTASDGVARTDGAGAALAVSPIPSAEAAAPAAASGLGASSIPSLSGAEETAKRVPLLDSVAVHASLSRVPGATRNWVFAVGYGLLFRVLHKGPVTRKSWTLDLTPDQAADFLACIESVRRVLAAQAAKTLPAALHRQLGPAARIAGVFHEQGERLPDWLGLLGLLEECIWTWDAPESMPRRPYDAIYSRDGFRCMAPGCTARVHLEAHHLQYRSHGVNENHWNLLVLCRFHHQQGEHGLLAECRGQAPLEVDWRLGHPDLATYWRNEMRQRPRPSREGKSVAAVLEALVAIGEE